MRFLQRTRAYWIQKCTLWRNSRIYYWKLYVYTERKLRVIMCKIMRWTRPSFQLPTAYTVCVCVLKLKKNFQRQFASYGTMNLWKNPHSLFEISLFQKRILKVHPINIWPPSHFIANIRNVFSTKAFPTWFLSLVQYGYYN